MNHLERALDKQNQWWKYLLVFLIGFVASNLIGAIPLLIIIILKTLQNGEMAVTASRNMMDLSVYGISPNVGLILIMFPFLVGLISVILVFKPFHKRSYKEIINGTNKIRWQRFFFSFIVWGILLAIYLFLDYLINPGNYVVRFHLSTLIPLVVISLVLIPFQTTFEEILFRGYLTQGIGAWTRNRWMALIIPALLFGLMHSFNPEVKEYGFWVAMPQYIIMGLVFGLVTILDDGIEVSMGAHSANNIFLSVFVTDKASVLQTPALLEQQHVQPNKETLYLLIFSVIFISYLYYKFHWNFGIFKQPIQENNVSEDLIPG